MDLESNALPNDGIHDGFGVVETLNRYLQAIDLADVALLENCFSADATAIYDGVVAGRRREEIVGYLLGRGVGSTDSWAASTHSLANWTVRFDGPLAIAESLVEAVLVDAPRGSGRTLRRGLRYSDELVRASRTWLIFRRQHRLLWMYDVEGVSVV